MCVYVSNCERSSNLKTSGLGPIWTVVSQKKKWDTTLGNNTVTSNRESKTGTGAQLRK